jgi:chitinase
VSVNFSTAEGDTAWWGGWNGYYYYGPEPVKATAGVDYQSQAGTLTFAPGETAKTVTVLVNGDRAGEPDEAFSVDLGGAAGALVTSGHATATIYDDEPRVSIGYAQVTEGNAGTKVLTFAVTLSAAYDQEVRVAYATADGSATAGTDYQAASGTLVFAPGQTAATISVVVYGDRVAEWDESLLVLLGAPTANAVIASGTGYGTITDDEPRVSVGDARVTEGNSGTRYLTFTVTLSAAYDASVTVNYATQDGTAVAGSDYKAASGTLTFAKGETTKTVTIAIYGDSTVESDEYFYLRLSSPSGDVQLANDLGIALIVNDDKKKGNSRK